MGEELRCEEAVVVDEVRPEVEVDLVLVAVVEEAELAFREAVVEALRPGDEVHLEEADLEEEEARWGVVCGELLYLAFGSCVQNHSRGIGHSIKLNGIICDFHF